jgi:hypothetical protein
MGRYYADYYPGEFPNQQLLNEAIDPNNQACLLQTDEANALTIRLLVCAEAVAHLDELIRQETDAKLKRIANTLWPNFGSQQRPTGLVWGTQSQFYTGGSGIAYPEPYLHDPSGQYQSYQLPTGFNYQNNRISFDRGQEYAFPLVKAHISVYNFFTNYGSTLDRFSGEVNRLFSLLIRADRIDWDELRRHQPQLTGKNTQLSSEIDNYHNRSGARLLRYRNRLIHDGLIRMTAVVTGLDQWEVMVPEDPDSPVSPLTQNALNLCRDGLKSLIEFLNTSYGIILSRLSSVGQPPW